MSSLAGHINPNIFIGVKMKDEDASDPNPKYPGISLLANFYGSPPSCSPPISPTNSLASLFFGLLPPLAIPGTLSNHSSPVPLSLAKKKTNSHGSLQSLSPPVSPANSLASLFAGSPSALSIHGAPSNGSSPAPPLLANEGMISAVDGSNIPLSLSATTSSLSDPVLAHS